jgi:hypothetical protein
MIGFARKFLLIVPVALIVGFCLRPTPILGVDGESLAASVGVPVGDVGFGPCSEAPLREQSEDLWECSLPNDPDSPDAGTTKYSVRTDGLGCWEISGSGDGAEPEKSDGCVTILDHIQATD